MTEHMHAWSRGQCRSCGALRCEHQNDGAWKCTRERLHTDAHQYADGTTGAQTP